MVNPTGYTALDLVGFSDKGAYSSAATYVKNDLAHYAGNIWRCLLDDTTAITPAEGLNWTIFIAEPSNAVESSIAPIETSPAEADHAVNTQLYYNDTLYKVIAAIDIGDTLTVGTNIQLADNITTQLSQKANTSSLANVATSGSYSDLSNKPTLGTAAAKDTTNVIAQNSTDPVESGAVYTSETALGSRIDAVDEEIAPIESGTVASQVYAIGDHFIKDDVLYKAKTAIAQGETLTLNTNYEVADNVTDQLASLKEALTNAQSDVTKNQTNIAYINTNSTTASKIYTAGEQFILDGALKRAKTNIASGATLVLNSNYENADSVTRQIKMSGEWQRLAAFTNTESDNITLSASLGQFKTLALCLSNTLQDTIDSTTFIPVSSFKGGYYLSASRASEAAGAVRCWNALTSYVDDTTISGRVGSTLSSIPAKAILFGIY